METHITKEFIQQQQEVTREKWLKAPFFDAFREGELQLLDILIAEAIANIGRELVRRCEGELIMEHRAVQMECGYNDGLNSATDIISDVTGISPTR